MSRNPNKRKCCACQQLKDKEELCKITRLHDSGEIVVNPSSNQQGRSTYICKTEACLNTAFKKKRIQKSLKKNVTNEELEKIKAVLESIIVLKLY